MMIIFLFFYGLAFVYLLIKNKSIFSLILAILLNIIILKNSHAKYERFKIDFYQKPLLFPEISFLDDIGNSHLIEEFDGSIILVNIWASWCNVCINEIPELDLLQKKFLKKPIKILAISEDFKGIEKIKEFYRQYNIKYLDIYLDNQNKLFNNLNIISLPTSFIINEDGYIIAKITGEIDWNNDKEINQILIDASLNASVNYNKKPQNINIEPKKQEIKKGDISEKAITYLN